MDRVLPPEWLCIDRYRDKEAMRQRMIEKSGAKDIDIRALGDSGLIGGRKQCDWKDPDIINYIIEEGQTKSFSEIGHVLGVDSHAVQRAYELYRDKGLCGPKPRVTHAYGVVHDYVNDDEDDDE